MAPPYSLQAVLQTNIFQGIYSLAFAEDLQGVPMVYSVANNCTGQSVSLPTICMNRKMLNNPETDFGSLYVRNFTNQALLVFPNATASDGSLTLRIQEAELDNDLTVWITVQNVNGPILTTYLTRWSMDLSTFYRSVNISQMVSSPQTEVFFEYITCRLYFKETTRVTYLNLNCEPPAAGYGLLNSTVKLVFFDLSTFVANPTYTAALSLQSFDVQNLGNPYILATYQTLKGNVVDQLMHFNSSGALLSSNASVFSYPFNPLSSNEVYSSPWGSMVATDNQNLYIRTCQNYQNPCVCNPVQGVCVYSECRCATPYLVGVYPSCNDTNECLLPSRGGCVNTSYCLNYYGGYTCQSGGAELLSWRNLNPLATFSSPFGGVSAALALGVQDLSLATRGYYNFGFSTQLGTLATNFSWAQVGIYAGVDDRDLMNTYGVPNTGFTINNPITAIAYSVLEETDVYLGTFCATGATCLVWLNTYSGQLLGQTAIPSLVASGPIVALTMTLATDTVWATMAQNPAGVVSLETNRFEFDLTPVSTCYIAGAQTGPNTCVPTQTTGAFWNPDQVRTCISFRGEHISVNAGYQLVYNTSFEVITSYLPYLGGGSDCYAQFSQFYIPQTVLTNVYPYRSFDQDLFSTYIYIALDAAYSTENALSIFLSNPTGGPATFLMNASLTYMAPNTSSIGQQSYYTITVDSNSNVVATCGALQAATQWLDDPSLGGQADSTMMYLFPFSEHPCNTSNNGNCGTRLCVRTPSNKNRCDACTEFNSTYVYTAWQSAIHGNDSGFQPTLVYSNPYTTLGTQLTPPYLYLASINSQFVYQLNAITSALVLNQSTYLMANTTNSTTSSVFLASACTYAVLAGSTITNTGASVVGGNVGLTPGSSVTGFPPGTITGTLNVDNSAATQAAADFNAAYTNAAGRTGGTTVAGNLGGQTLPPGVYTSTSSLAISSGNLILDAGGNANGVWIFQMVSTLTTTTGNNVVLANGAQSSNVFWQVGSSATLGTGTTFYGTILADVSITITTGAILNGRALANQAVTLDTNTITVPSCSSTTASGGGVAFLAQSIDNQTLLYAATSPVFATMPFRLVVTATTSTSLVYSLTYLQLNCRSLFTDTGYAILGFTINRVRKLIVVVQGINNGQVVMSTWYSNLTCIAAQDITSYLKVSHTLPLTGVSFSYDYNWMFFQTNQSFPVQMFPLGGMDYVSQYWSQVITATTPIQYLGDATATQPSMGISTSSHGVTAVVVTRNITNSGPFLFPVAYYAAKVIDHNAQTVAEVVLYAFNEQGTIVTTDVPFFTHLASFGDLFTIATPSFSIYRTPCRNFV